MQILKFKKTDPKAIIPRRQTEGAAGFDLHALEAEYLHKTTTPLMVRTGVSVEIPPGHLGLIRDRSPTAVINSRRVVMLSRLAIGYPCQTSDR